LVDKELGKMDQIPHFSAYPRQAAGWVEEMARTERLAVLVVAQAGA
jgi:hypothetical protein